MSFDIWHPFANLYILVFSETTGLILNKVIYNHSYGVYFQKLYLMTMPN